VSRWPQVPLGELIAEKRGSVDPSKFPDEVFDLYSIPAFDLGQPEVRAGNEIGSAKQIVCPQDVLLSRIVPHIRRAWVVGEIRGRRMVASGEWIVFRHPKIHPRYLRFFLIGDPFHARFMQTVSGVGGSLLRAKASEVGKIQLSIPPLGEQERIVTLLDEADQLRKLRAQADRRNADLIPALFHETFGDPGNLRNRTVVATVGDLLGDGRIIEIQDGNHGEIHPKAAEYTSEGVPFIFANHISKNQVDLTTCPYLTQNRAGKLRVGFARPGDVLLSHKGSIGFTAIVPVGLQTAVLSPQVTYYRLNCKALDPFYTWAYFQTSFFRSELKRLSQQATRAYVGITRQKELPFLLPRLTLQKEFAKWVTAIRKLEAKQAASRERLDALLQSMLHRAFRGEL